MILRFYTRLPPHRTRERLKLEAPQGPPHLTVLHLFAVPPPQPPISELLGGGGGGQHYVTPRLRHSDVTPPPPQVLLPAGSRSAPPPPSTPPPTPGGRGAGAGWKRWVRRGGTAAFGPSSLSYGIFQNGLASFLSFLSL